MTDSLTLSSALRRRLRRWESITGLSLADMAPRATDAHNGYEVEDYGSGYGAGEAHADALPDGPRSSDARIRAWGDFLIDLGWAAAPAR